MLDVESFRFGIRTNGRRQVKFYILKTQHKTMIKQFDILQLFPITEGKLTRDGGIDDVYDVLNHICDSNLMTHHLPTAKDYLELKSPKWLMEEVAKIKQIKAEIGDVPFSALIDTIKEKYFRTIAVPQLKDEFDTTDFGEYMIEHSLLNRIGSKA